MFPDWQGFAQGNILTVLRHKQPREQNDYHEHHQSRRQDRHSRCHADLLNRLPVGIRHIFLNIHCLGIDAAFRQDLGTRG